MFLRFGRLGAATIAPGARLITYAVVAAHPPFPVVIVMLVLAGFGSGHQNASYNAWLGTTNGATHLLSFLHAFYGLGALLAPSIATSMIVKGGLMWYTFFYLMVGFRIHDAMHLSSQRHPVDSNTDGGASLGNPGGRSGILG
jgi:fucose permease